MHYVVETEPGLEAMLVDELRDVDPGARVAELGPRPAGRVVVEMGAAVELERVRLAQHVVAVRSLGPGGSLDDVRTVAAAADLAELTHAASFRVTAQLAGDQPYGGSEAAGAAGAVLVERYGTAVDLEGYAVNVRLDVVGGRAIVGVQLNREPLGRRIRRGRPLRGAVKPTVAAAMIRLAGGHRGRHRLLDPVCGAATIPVEAKLLNPELRVSASDWDPATVAAAERTVANHGVDVVVRRADARRLTEVWAGERFDVITANIPWGQRLGRRVSLSALYAELLAGMLEVLADGGRMVVLSPRVKALERACTRLSLRLVREIAVETGGMQPRLRLLELR